MGFLFKLTSNTYPYYIQVVRWSLIKIKDVESPLLKFRINFCYQYLPILYTGCKMVIIKNKGCRMIFIQAN